MFPRTSKPISESRKPFIPAILHCENLTDVYNQAISDAQSYLQEKTLDLVYGCYAPDFTFWASHDKKRRNGKLAAGTWP
jgi:hypothetical protein